jgi:hypothetical protein
MSSAVSQRLDLERRLLAALFLWPRQVDLEAHHFAALAHAAFFCALEQARPVMWTNEGWPRLLEALKRSGELKLFRHAGGVMHFVNQTLPLEWATPESIEPLTKAVRACPRCGR